MNTKLILVGLLPAVFSLQAATPPPATLPPPPPPPVVTAPSTSDDQFSVEAKTVINTVLVTNAILTTNVTLVTNVLVVTNTVLVTNLIPKAEYVYDQRPLAGRPMLVSPEQAKAVIDRFRSNYAKLGSPRMLIYVNRALVDDQSGMKLTARTERTVIARGSVRGNFQADPNAVKAGNAQTPSVSVNNSGNVTVTGGERQPGKSSTTFGTDRASNVNIYRIQDRKELTLEDRQTVRDVERLFGRPLRLGGASLADQTLATQLIADKPLKAFVVATEGTQARKDREALSKIADVVVEVLITSRSIVVTEVSGDKVYPVPDIQATAIRLSDAKIVGQATAADLIGKDRAAGRVVRNFDVRDITEATALSLMEDMLLGVQ